MWHVLHQGCYLSWVTHLHSQSLKCDISDAVGVWNWGHVQVLYAELSLQSVVTFKPWAFFCKCEVLIVIVNIVTSLSFKSGVHVWSMCNSDMHVLLLSCWRRCPYEESTLSLCLTFKVLALLSDSVLKYKLGGFQHHLQLMNSKPVTSNYTTLPHFPSTPHCLLHCCSQSPSKHRHLLFKHSPCCFHCWAPAAV